MRRFFCFTLCASLCIAWISSFAEEIRVNLNTASPLQPLYIGKIQGKNTSFSISYLNQLEGILSYDFNYNGMTVVFPRSVEKEKLLQNQEERVAFNPAAWKEMGIAYALQLTLQGNTLHASCFTTQSGSLKKFSSITLNGKLHEDRVRIHKLADAVFKTLFQTDGVASSRLLFAYQTKARNGDKDSISEIWECDWDGGNLKQITHENSYCVTPVLLPYSSQFGNDKFLYVSYKLGQPKIYIASLSDGVGERLIDLRGNQILPSVSQKRDKIAFISDAGGRTDLFVQPFDSANFDRDKPVQLYSYPRSTQASPTFSPDGSTIAFVSDKDGGTRIYTLPANSSSKRGNAILITKKNKENTCPSWSPDGKKIAYSAKTNGIRQIWIYDLVSKEENQLTTGPGNKENPCWAPDSKHLVFNSTDADVSELYVVNLNQPDAIKITKGPGKKHYPAWGKR